MNIASWLQRAGQIAPEAIALQKGAQPVRSYADFADRSSRLANTLQSHWNLPIGSHIAIAAKNSTDYLEILFAIWHAGMVAVPVNAKLHPKEMQWILENAQAKALFYSADLEDDLEAMRPEGLTAMAQVGSPAYEALLNAEPATIAERNADDLAWLFYTSGTTGKPKGAMLSHRNLAAMSWAYLVEVDPCKPSDILYHAAPMSHGSGLYAMATVLARGINAVAPSGGFDAEEVLSFVTEHPNTSLFAAPTMIKRMVSEAQANETSNGVGRYKSSNFRRIIWGGAPMHVADIKQAHAVLGPCLTQIYGQGESPMTISLLPQSDLTQAVEQGDDAILASAGFTNSAVTIKIAGASQPNEIGEILVKGDSVMLGYWNNPQATEKSLRDGWLLTGDIGCLDQAGYLHLKDRSKDVIISGGSNIYPREVEEILLSHTGVSECSVIGREDADWGEVVIAYYVGTATLEELDRLCLTSIARFKRPKAYIALESLPKNNYGKILKTQLRDLDARMAAKD